MYRVARDAALAPAERWRRFRGLRDALLFTHPRSPLAAADRHAGGSVPYFPFDPGMRVLAEAEPDAGEPFEVPLRDDGVLRLARLGWLHFELRRRPARLALYRQLGYGGGLFVPLRDATAGAGSYGGGRYLIDTVKHADLGSEDGRMVLDFNYAYHPSCAYSPRWDCPLAPPENRLEMRIEAGERLPDADWRAARV